MLLRRAARQGAVLAAAVALVMAWAGTARAQIGSARYAAIVLDHRTGQTLFAANPDEQRHPASLTKMMTLYMVFEALKEERLSLSSRVVVSEEAASRPPSKLGISAGNSITVEQAILALVTRSANDIATALGETLSGSESRFAQSMTLRARALGMSRTTFRNASGLPDPEQVTTARDMATLGRRLIEDFPDRYHYFGVAQARFGGMNIRNHNRMLTSYEGVDGIKTGFINASGFNIVTSAKRGGQRLVGAVFGGSSWVERDTHMAALLDRSFEQVGVRTEVAEGRAPVLMRTATAAPLPRSAAAARATPAARQQARSTRSTRRPVAASTARSRSATATAAKPEKRAVRTAAPAVRPTRTAAKSPARQVQPRRSPQRTAAAPARQTTSKLGRAPEPLPAPVRTASR